MAEDKVVSNVLQRLEDLRIEHVSLINTLGSPRNEKSDIILKNIKSIDVGLDEAQLMMEFTSHLQNIDVEKQKLHSQLKQFSQENSNLRDELCDAREKLRTFEQMVAELEKHKKNLEFIVSAQMESDDEKEFNAVSTSDPITQLDEFFATDASNSSDLSLTLKASKQTVYLESDEYEILTRFRTLQNMVIQYASEGRYEVAAPICKQALEDLEKTTIGRHHPYVPTMLSILSIVYGLQNKYRNAANLLNEAIREKLQPTSFQCMVDQVSASPYQCDEE